MNKCLMLVAALMAAFGHPSYSGGEKRNSETRCELGFLSFL